MLCPHIGHLNRPILPSMHSRDGLANNDRQSLFAPQPAHASPNKAPSAASPARPRLLPCPANFHCPIHQPHPGKPPASKNRSPDPSAQREPYAVRTPTPGTPPKTPKRAFIASKNTPAGGTALAERQAQKSRRRRRPLTSPQRATLTLSPPFLPFAPALRLKRCRRPFHRRNTDAIPT